MKTVGDHDDRMKNFEEDPLALATEDLLLMPGIGKRLSVIDRHILAFGEDADDLQLPPEYKILQPVVNKYRKDLPGFTQYLRELRDELPNRSGEWREVQLVYRKVNTRLIQRQRRELTNMALEKNLVKYGQVKFQERLKWISRLEALWAKKRILFLEEMRAEGKNPHIKIEELNEILTEFWKNVKTDIEAGKYILPWDFSLEEALKKDNDVAGQA